MLDAFRCEFRNKAYVTGPTLAACHQRRCECLWLALGTVFSLFVYLRVNSQVKMLKTTAWKNGVWLPTENASLSLDDIGFLQGVVIVDRLRTCRSRALDITEHLERFRQSCAAVGIQLRDTENFEGVVEECVLRNQDHFAGRDFSIVLLATPGTLDGESNTPTLIVHPWAIPWNRLATWYSTGQRLVASKQRSIPSECWSTAIKTRARLHYYLADQAALANTGDPHAAAVLLDENGCLTETSSANLVLIEGNAIISPPRVAILWGISLNRTLRLAEACGIEVLFERVTPQRARQSDAILLSGSTGCVWPASQFEERIFEHAATQSIVARLTTAWQHDIDFDFIEQAASIARLPTNDL
jgi:branched-chain amino acid aminotransferase